MVSEYFSGKILSWRKDSGGRIVSLLVSFNGVKYNVVNVYAPTNHTDRKSFFETLHEFFFPADFLIIGGDFNCYEYESDKFCGNVSLAAYLTEFRNTFNLVDVWRKIYPRSRDVSWFNSDFSIGSRLDKFFISKSLLQSVFSCSIVPCCFSDHDFVHLHINSAGVIPRGPGVWKFNNSLLSDTDFCSFISDRITDLSSCFSVFESVCDWWEFCKSSLQLDIIDYAKSKRKMLFREKVSLTNRIIRLKQCLVQGDETAAAEILSLEAQLKALHFHVLEGAKVRSRVQWLEEGEKPTRFFFQLEKERAEKHEIGSILNLQGVEVFSRAAIEQAHVDFYSNLFAAENIDLISQQRLFSNVKTKLSDTDRDLCEGAVTLAEITAAVKSLSLNKSPGPDGFTLEFYLHFWNLLGPILINVYNDSFNRGFLTESMRSSVTRLLYKKRGNIKELKNWRPISLLNVDYKIISKAITLRLSQVIGSLVDPDQTCSVPGRSISSNLTLLRDVLDYIDRTGEAGILVSLDQEKAFDRVNYSFLFNLLSHFGFGPDFLKWIRTLYFEANMRIILNGWLTDRIFLRRGVRQGDPLSPLLYVLCVEVLAIQIRFDSRIRGFLLPGAGLHFKVRNYADDTTTFIRDLPSLSALFDVVSLYERGSGAKLNRGKTEAMWVGAWKSRDDEPFGLTWVNKMKILGVWFGTVPVEQDNWQPKINKFEKSVNLWKSRSLSLIGKAMIINIIGLSKFFYLASILLLPDWVVRRVNQIIWPFLWGSRLETVARNTCFCRVEEGGLGLTNFVLKCEALRTASMLNTVRNLGDKSFFLCKYFVGWQLARLHKDWAALRDNSSPSSFFPTSFYSSCVSVLSRLNLDKVQLSTKGIYLFLLKVKSSSPGVHRVWAPYLGSGFSVVDYWAKVRDSADGKMNDLFWLIALRGIKVRDSLRNWGYISSDRCAVCPRKETIDHCFVNCARAKRVWSHFRPILILLTGYALPINLATIFFFWFPNSSVKKAFLARFIIKNVLFSIWIFRNKSTFHNGNEDHRAIIKFALHSIKGRVKLDFHRLPRGKFSSQWVLPGFCSLRGDVLVFHF